MLLFHCSDNLLFYYKLKVLIQKQLKHDHIVNLIEVFRRKGKLYLVFEHVDHTILEDLDKNPHGLSDDKNTGIVRKCMWQLLKAMDYLHSHNVSVFFLLKLGKETKAT